MVSTLTILACIVTLLVTLVLPVVLLLLFLKKHPRKGILPAWLLGAAGFFVTQILIRVPILTVLQTQPWFMAFAQNQIFGYVFLLAFTAGLFELAGRFAVAKLLHRDLSRERSLVAGLGHGGIEAMVLIGATYISNLAFIVMINTGTYDILLAQAGGQELIISQLELIRSQLVDSSPVLFLLAAYERILTMVLHVAMSMLVCYGIARKKTLVCCLMCLGFHTALDLTAGISALAGTALSQTAVYAIVYTLLTAVALLSLYVIRELCRRWPLKEVTHDYEK